MNKEAAKEMYYIARYNMERYVKTSFGICYRIVGFFYINDIEKGLIVIDCSYHYNVKYNDIKNWRGVNKIFLNKDDKKKFCYGVFYYPFSGDCNIVSS